MILYDRIEGRSVHIHVNMMVYYIVIIFTVAKLCSGRVDITTRWQWQILMLRWQKEIIPRKKNIFSAILRFAAWKMCNFFFFLSFCYPFWNLSIVASICRIQRFSLLYTYHAIWIFLRFSAFSIVFGFSCLYARNHVTSINKHQLPLAAV